MLFKAGFRTYRVIGTASKARRLARGPRLKIKPEDAGSIVLSLWASCHWTTSVSECSLEPSLDFDFLLCFHGCSSDWNQARMNLTRMPSIPDDFVVCSCASLHHTLCWSCLWEGRFPYISAGQAIQQGDGQVKGGYDVVFAPSSTFCFLPSACSIRTGWSSSSFGRFASYDDACLGTQLLLSHDNFSFGLWSFFQGSLRPRPFFPFWRHGPLFHKKTLATWLPCQAFCIRMLSSLDCTGSFHRALDCRFLVSWSSQACCLH